MSMIVLDLEWNEPCLERLPKAARLNPVTFKEIIQFGAVRLDAEGPGAHFQTLVKPSRYPKLHWRVRKLTGLTNDKVAAGVPFPEAVAAFQAWCGPDPVLLTWGFDDIPVLRSNLQACGLDEDWLSRWFNLQLMFSAQTNQEQRQRSLEFALDYYGIGHDQPLHDAFHDAWYTGEVCRRLDLEKGMEDYPVLKLPRPRPERAAVRATLVRAEETGEEDIQVQFEGYKSRQDIFSDPQVGRKHCPECGRRLRESTNWLRLGDRYLALAQCPDHGKYLIRLKVKRGSNGLLRVLKSTTRADEEREQYYYAQANRPRRRSGRRGH